MKGTASVPDAWDDDWETVADKPDTTQDTLPEEPVKLSKAERKAQHAEANKKLWESAESQNTPIFLQAKDKAPLTSDFKAPLKLLSRKPPEAKAGAGSRATGDPAQAGADDGEDSEEEERRRAAQSFAERQAKAQREREEKQRKYAEARERILGSPVDDAQSRPSSKIGQHSRSRNSSRGKGRGRAEFEGPSSNDQSPARGTTTKRQLFDPNYTSKPTSTLPHRAAGSEVRLEATSESQHIRAPRGPDGSGRGGFGFAPRGARTGAST